MTPLVFLFALALGHVTAGVVELNCSDNATCIEHMLRETARSLRQQKSVRLFNAITIEPLKGRQARSNEGPLAKFSKSHAFSFDWNDYEFRLTRPEGRSDALDLEVYESRNAKDDSDENPKTSSSKVEEDKETDKGPHNKIRRRRRHKKKILMAVIPLLFGMKSAAVVIFAMAIVTVLTLKAYIASKVALLVTVGMAAKKLYESYSSGVPETSNVLWNLARYFRVLFGLSPPPLSASTMAMPMYVLPQMYEAEPMSMQMQPVQT